MTEAKAKLARDRQRKQAAKERELVKAQMKGFDPNTCDAYKLLCNRLKEKKLTVTLIQPIDEAISAITNIRIPREAQRLKGPLIKWLNDHYDILQESLPQMRFHFVGGEVIESECAGTT